MDTALSPTPDLWAQSSPPGSPCWSLNRKLAGDAKKPARVLRGSLDYFNGLMFQSEMSEMIFRIRLPSYQMAIPFSHPCELLELSLLSLQSGRFPAFSRGGIVAHLFSTIRCHVPAIMIWSQTFVGESPRRESFELTCFSFRTMG